MQPEGDKAQEQYYGIDPVAKFLRDRIGLTPTRIMLAAIGIAILDLAAARFVYDLYDSREEIVGAIHDPPYLLTMFLVIPLFLRTFLWMPEGLSDIFTSLKSNGVIAPADEEAYDANVTGMVDRYSRGRWVLIRVFIAVAIQGLVIWGNYQVRDTTYNTSLYDTAIVIRFSLRAFYGLLAVYGATAVVIRFSGLSLDELLTGLKARIVPLDPDRAAGYGAFSRCSLNLLYIYLGLGVFFLSKLLFRLSGQEIVFGFVGEPLLIAATIAALAVGYYVFIHRPTRVAARAIKDAKTRNLGALSKRYQKEHRVLMTALEKNEAEDLKKSSARVEALRKEATQIFEVSDSPVNREALGRYGLYSLLVVALPYLSNLLLYVLSVDPAELNRLAALNAVESLRALILILATGEFNGS